MSDGNCSSAFLLLRDFVSNPSKEALACSGRLNLCSKTRELTDNQPKYTYRRQSNYNPDGGVAVGGARENSAGAESTGRGWGGVEDTVGREAGGAAGPSYRDVGDRLYSEWKEARRRHARRQKVEAARETASPEGWSCPKCGVDNRQERQETMHEGSEYLFSFGSPRLFARPKKDTLQYLSQVPACL